jgi:hypothetical protein
MLEEERSSSPENKNHNYDNEEEKDDDAVTINGVKFYSDRFYLNAPIGLPFYSQDHKSSNSNNNNSDNDADGKPPAMPLLDRSQLISNLKLKAAIVGTYVFDPTWISYELPMLFPPSVAPNEKENKYGNRNRCDNNDTRITSAPIVPTLLLHGHKGIYNDANQKQHYRNKFLQERNEVLQREENTRKKNDNGNMNVKNKDGPNKKRKRKDYKNNVNDNRQQQEVICIDDSDSDDNANDENQTASHQDDSKDKEYYQESPTIAASKSLFVHDGMKKKTKKKNHHCIQLLASKHGKKLFCPPSFSLSSPSLLKSTTRTTDSTSNVKSKNNESMRKKQPQKHKQLFGPSVFVSQVLPQWIQPAIPTSLEHHNCHRDSHHDQQVKKQQKAPPPSSSSSSQNVIVIDNSSDEDDDNAIHNRHQHQNPKTINKATDKKYEKKKRCMGVYHPKFMILFETSGSIIVTISTSNLTRPSGVDGTWLQRFHPKKKGINHTIKQSRRSTKEPCDTSDFAHVLCDLLQKQSDAVEKDNAMTPITFLKQYLNVSSLFEFEQLYNFESANVHLVTTVPGVYPGRFGTKHLSIIQHHNQKQEEDQEHGPKSNNSNVVPKNSKKRKRYNRRIFYGPQRVSDVLHKCTTQHNPWLPKHVLSKYDKLILQTTSFGAKWDRNHFIQMVEQYMGYDTHPSIRERQKRTHGDDGDFDADQLLNSVDIIWPTKQLMEDIGVDMRTKYSAMKDVKNIELIDEELFFQHFAFLSSNAFNLLDQDCLARMTKYEEQDPSLLPYTVSPHIKSYARIMSNYKGNNQIDRIIKNGKKQSKGHDNDNGDINLAWFMLTSACLSRGAQGQAEKESTLFDGSDEKTYLNFELGVLFCSRLQGNPMTDRLYRCYDANLQHLNSTSPIKIINLPIPYKMDSKPYQQPCTDEKDFNEDPFLHEITMESVVKGNMALTPLGKKIRESFS